MRGAGVDASGPAMATLCRSYWSPVLGFLRRRGLSPADAEDACQSFFAWLLESNAVGSADRVRGRFRDFLLASLRQFLIREHRHAGAAKRRPAGGVLSMDALEGADAGSGAQPAARETSPDAGFDAAWAMALLGRVNDRLGEEWRTAGRGGRFDAIKSFITDADALRGRDVAAQVGMSEGAFRVAVYRFKQRFGELLRQEVAFTLDEGGDVDAEIADLRRALRAAP